MARQELSVTARVAVGSAVAVASLAIGVAVTAAAVTIIFARMVITPPKRRQEDLVVLAVTEDAITLSPALDSMTPGRYSLRFAGDSGHARVGEILSHTPWSVTRQLLGVDLGDISSARQGRFSGWYFLDPRDLGFPVEDVEVQTELGPAPAWLVRAAEPSGLWMIGVHGRAAQRGETIRSVPVFHEAGYTSLLVTYRNDGDAPRTRDHRYALGDTEWVDVESAMRFAIDHGATEIVLMGWSMGGAIVLQVVTRSPLAAAVRGVVLESPVVDWRTALDFHGVANRLPKPLRLGVLHLLGSRWASFVTGQAAPVDLARLDLVTRSGELDVPILLLHSDDDGLVPPDASIALAHARPDIVTFERFVTARHARLWNYDEARWNTVIASWLARLSQSIVQTGNRPCS